MFSLSAPTPVPPLPRAFFAATPPPAKKLEVFIVSVHFAQPRSSSLLKHVSPDLSAADDEEREGFQIQLATEGAGTARLPNRGPTDQTGKAAHRRRGARVADGGSGGR